MILTRKVLISHKFLKWYLIYNNSYIVILRNSLEVCFLKKNLLIILEKDKLYIILEHKKKWSIKILFKKLSKDNKIKIFQLEKGLFITLQVISIFKFKTKYDKRFNKIEKKKNLIFLHYSKKIQIFNKKKILIK
jgi:hypothetical protein